MMDSIRSMCHVSFVLLVCAICACVFKGERFIVFKWLSVVHMVMCEAATVFQNRSIKLFRYIATGPNLSLTTYHSAYHVPLILVVSNDAGSAFDCICCFC